MATTLVDDFEDGDITITATDWSGWNGDTASFSADNTSPIAGSFSGRLDASSESVRVEAVRTSEQTKRVDATVRIDTQTGDLDDSVFVSYVDAGNLTEAVEFRGDGSISGSTILTPTWSAGVAVDVSIRLNDKDGEIEIYIDGNLEESANTSVSGLEEIRLRNDTTGSGGSVSAYFDDIESIDPPVEPPDLTIDDTRADEIDISTTFTNDAEEVDLYRSETSPVTTGDTLVNTYTSAGQFTDTGLENGERYYYAAVAKDTDGPRPDSSLSSEVDGTTTVPAPIINTTSPDSQNQITVTWTLQDNSTDGDVDVLRDSTVIATVGTGTTSYSDGGLVEATSYDYEIRRNTDHTSTTSAVDSQYTKPNAPTALTATPDENDGTIDLSWSDESAGEDGFEILENKNSTGVIIIDSVASNTTSYTTGSKDRVGSYEYQVRAVVGSGSEQASSLSNIDTATFETFANYWVEITPPGGTSELFADPHVAYVDLEHTAIHGAGVVLSNVDADISNWGPKTDIEIFLDDSRIFSGEIIRLREDTPSEGQTDITAKGPLKELENSGPGSVVTYNSTPGYLAIEDYYDNQISNITVNSTVNPPTGNTVENDTLVVSADLSGYGAIVESDLTQVPIETAGSILLEESAFIGVEDDFSGTFTVQADSPGSPPYHISGEWAVVGNNDTIGYTFSPTYDIPAERVGVAVHLDVQDAIGTLATLSWTLNGDDLDETALLSPDANRWVNLPNDYSGGDLQAGNNYSMDISTGDYAFDIDGMVVYDKDYVSGTFTDVTSLGETLDNPVPHNPVEIDIENEARPNAIKTARVDATISNLGGDFRHRISIDGEATELTATTEDATFDFNGNGQYGRTLEPFLRLDGQGSNTTFSSGVNPQEVTKLDYYLTTTDTTLVEDLELTGSHYDNIRRLHSISNLRFVTDPRTDPADGITIETFEPGSAASQKSTDFTILDVDVEREFDGYANAVTVAYEDTNGDVQTFVGTADSSEVSRVGSEVRKVIYDTTISTNDEARIVSEREKRKRIARDKTTGEITSVAKFVLPGYSYDIPEFGGYTPLDGRVSYRESVQSASMELKFKPDRDNVNRLLETQEDLETVKRS